MARKNKNPGIYLYPHDILSSPRCRSLTPGGAGIYFFLFLRLCDPPMPGAYRLRDWEPHPKWAKSDTRKCVHIADKRERLPLFAKWLAKNDLPWTKSEVLPYLQELYDRGIVIIEGDMLIQPRLFVDNGFDIPDIDGDGNPVGSILDDPVSGQMQAFDNTLQGGLNIKKNNGAKNGIEKGTKNGTKKGTKNPRVGGRDAQAQSKRVGVRDINIDNSKKETGGNEKTNSDKSKNTSVRKTSAKPATDKNKTTVADNPPTLEEVQAYASERASQGKEFRFVTPEQFFDTCEAAGWMRNGKPLYSWKAYFRNFETYRKNHGDKPVDRPKPSNGESVPATPPAEGKYKKW